MTPRMNIALEVLDMAKDNDDAGMIAVCRRVIEADRIGWRKHGDPADYRAVLDAYEATR
jgi:hypothetical protein